MKWMPVMSIALGVMFSQIITLFTWPGGDAAKVVIAACWAALGVVWFANLKRSAQAGYKIRLDQQAFRALVRGQEIVAGPNRIILADIGYEAMADEIHEAKWRGTDGEEL